MLEPKKFWRNLCSVVLLSKFNPDLLFFLILFLTLIWVGFLGVRFEVRGRGVKLPSPTPSPPPSCLKLVRIMLET